jgi:putative membrane protein
MKTANDLAADRTGLANLRSHLANERTHLAYLRTAVSLVGFGITLNRFSLFLLQNRELSPEPTRWVLRNTESAGVGMVLLGIVVMAYSLQRFWRVSQDIERVQYVPRYRPVVVLTLAMLVLGGASALWLILL